MGQSGMKVISLQPVVQNEVMSVQMKETNSRDIMRNCDSDQ